MFGNEFGTFQLEARRRFLVLGAFMMGGVMILGGRLFHLQVMKGGEYHSLAEDNRISLQPMSALRGRILDRNGQILVENQPDFRLELIPELTGDLVGLLNHLQPYLNLTEEEMDAVLKQADRQRAFLPLKIKSHLSWEEVSVIESRIHTFPGATIQVQALRHYPHGGIAAHVLGYLGEFNKKDKVQFPATHFRSGDLVGKTGMERELEPKLRGVEGMREMEVNAVGRQIRELKLRPPRQGDDLSLTIDVDLQDAAEKALQGTSSSAVCLDPNNGEILAMVSQPAYDPNHFIRGFSGDEWKLLMTDPGRPLINKTLQGQYPPGSTFKIVVALAALSSGRISPEGRHYCSGSVVRDGHTFYCWKQGGHGEVDMVRALAESCDVYFYKVSEKVGIDAIERQARKLGLGELTGIALGGEREGLIPSRAWKRASFNTVWYPGETLISGIGQGYILTTPLQLANMMATVANGGNVYRPYLIRDPSQGQPEPMWQCHFNPDHLKVVRKGLFQVMNGPTGTARTSKPEKVLAAGKTGTSQVVRHKREKSGKLIKNTNDRLKDHALFVVYAPVENPRIAVSVVVEHGGHGSSVAAPLAKKILDFHFSRPGIL